MDMSRYRLSKLLSLNAKSKNSEGSVQSKNAKFITFWSSLNVAQRCYFSALCMLLFFFVFGLDDTEAYGLVIIPILFGLVREFAQKFAEIWHSIYGKAAVLFFYAVVANFAMGSAAGMVNEVTGVTAAHLPYSHNFALILNLPSWFVITSILALIAIQLLVPIYLLVLLLLKPFGIHRIWHKPNYQYVFTTAFVRYILSLVFLVHVNKLAAGGGLLSEQAEMLDDEIAVQLLESENDNAEDNENKYKEFIANNKKYRETQKDLLASFIFVFEADQYSRCTVPEKAKVVELNDFEILLIRRDDQAEHGYNYEVIACNSPTMKHIVVKEQ